MFCTKDGVKTLQALTVAIINMISNVLESLELYENSKTAIAVIEEAIDSYMLLAAQWSMLMIEIPAIVTKEFTLEVLV